MVEGLLVHREGRLLLGLEFLLRGEWGVRRAVAVWEGRLLFDMGFGCLWGMVFVFLEERVVVCGGVGRPWASVRWL